MAWTCRSLTGARGPASRASSTQEPVPHERGGLSSCHGASRPVDCPRMNVYFLLGLLLSVPLSVAANLLTPRIARRFASLSDSRASRSAQREREQREEAQWFVDRPELFTQRMLREVLGITMLGLCVAFLLGASAVELVLQMVAPPEMRQSSTLISVMAIAGELGAVIALSQAFTHFIGLAALFRRVRLLRKEQERADDVGAIGVPPKP